MIQYQQPETTTLVWDPGEMSKQLTLTLQHEDHHKINVYTIDTNLHAYYWMQCPSKLL